MMEIKYALLSFITLLIGTVIGSYIGVKIGLAEIKKDYATLQGKVVDLVVSVKEQSKELNDHDGRLKVVEDRQTRRLKEEF